MPVNSMQVSLAAVDSIVAALLGMKPGNIPFAPAPGISFDVFCGVLLHLAPKAFPSTTAEGALTFLLENHVASGIRPSFQVLDFLYEGCSLQLLRNYNRALTQLFVCYACLDDAGDNDSEEITPRTAAHSGSIRQAAATPLPHSPGAFSSSQKHDSSSFATSSCKGEFRQHAPLVKTMKTVDNREHDKHLPLSGRFLWARDAVVMFQDLGIIGASPPLISVSTFQQIFDSTCKHDPTSSFTKGLSFPEFELLLCQ
jgi:hypothetical protein